MIYLLLKPKANRFYISGVSYERPDSLHVALEDLLNGDTLLSNGMAAWDFALSCASFAPAWVSLSNAQYRLDIDVADIQAARISRIRANTTKAIFVYMPEWRQTRWNEYANLYEKLGAGNTLTPREQMIFDAMIDPGDTAENTYNAVVAALGWIHGCIAVHNAVEMAILAITDPVAALQFEGMPDYPGWVLG